MRSHCYSLFYLTQLFINYLLCSLVLIAHCSLFLFFTSSTLSHAVLIPTPCEIICPPNSHGNVWKNRSKAHVAPYCDAHFLPPCEKKLLKSLRASVRQTVSAWDKLARNVWIYHRNTLNKEREKACTFFFFLNAQTLPTFWTLTSSALHCWRWTKWSMTVYMDCTSSHWSHTLTFIESTKLAHTSVVRDIILFVGMGWR